MEHINFIVAVTKYLARRNIRKENFYLDLKFEGTVHHGGDYIGM